MSRCGALPPQATGIAQSRRLGGEPRPEAAVEVAGTTTARVEQGRRGVSALTDLAIDDNRRIGEVVDRVAQVVERDVATARDRGDRVLGRIPDVEDLPPLR